MKIDVKGIFHRYKGSAFVGNTGWMMSERLVQMVISLIVGMLTARYLGPSNYGIINYVAAFIAFGLPICGLGLEGVLVKAYVDDKEKAGAAIGTAILFESVTSVITSVVIVIIVSLSNAGDEVKTAVAMLESLQLIFSSATPIEFWYQSQLRSKYTSIVKITAYTVMALYRVVLLILQKSVLWFAFATSGDLMIIAVLYVVLYFRQENPSLKIDLSLGKALLDKSYHFILSGLMVVAYSQMDRIMLKHMIGDADVGLYSAAYNVCSLWFFIPTALIASARPVIMGAKNRDEKLYIRRLSQLYASVFWLGVAVALAVTLTSGLIIRILYGPGYEAASGSLSIGIWYGVFSQLGMARGVWILSENKNRYVKHYLFWGAIVNFVLNFILIRAIGINGAALATLITQFFTCMIAPVMYKETRIHTKIVIDAITLKWLRER